MTCLKKTLTRLFKSYLINVNLKACINYYLQLICRAKHSLVETKSSVKDK